MARGALSAADGTMGWQAERVVERVIEREPFQPSPQFQPFHREPSSGFTSGRPVRGRAKGGATRVAAIQPGRELA